jgi:soluble lytic murein transglycosylase-like protein
MPRGTPLPRLHVALGAGLLALSASVVHADIYKSVDEDGVISFTNTPSKGSQRVVKEKAKKAAAARAVMPRDRSPERVHRYDAYIREAATLYQIPEPLIRAVIKVESDFDPRALSPANAHGLMQLIPQTAERMMVQDIYDPRQNVFGGTRYLRILANLFNGDLQLTVAAYNAGENAVIRHGGIPPYAETQRYVVKVLEYYRHYRDQEHLAANSGG